MPTQNQFHNNPGLTGQWHGTIDTRCTTQISPPNMAFGLDRVNEAWRWTTQGEDEECDSTPDRIARRDYDDDPGFKMNKGAWNLFVMNTIFGYDSSAFTKVWINGKQVVDDVGWNAYNDEKGPYFKMGLYGHFDVDTIVY